MRLLQKAMNPIGISYKAIIFLMLIACKNSASSGESQGNGSSGALQTSAGVEDTINWNKKFSSAGANYDHARTIVTDGQRNVYVGGTGVNLVSGTSGQDWWIKKFSADGVEDTVNWDKKIGSAGSGSDDLYALAIDSAGGIYAVGYGNNLVSGTSGSDWWIKKFSSAGVEDTINWNKTFNSGGTGTDIAYSIAFDSSDNVYVSGMGTNLVTGSSSSDWWIKKFSNSGTEDTANWNKKYNSTGLNDEASCIRFISGAIFVGGFGTHLVSGTSSNDWWLKKFSVSGVEDTTNWNKAISSAGSLNDRIIALAADSAGNIFAAGTTFNAINGASLTDWWLKKFSATGVEDTSGWNKYFGDSSSTNEQPYDIKVDSSDYIYVIGSQMNLANGTSGYDWSIRKFDSSGMQITSGWNKAIDGGSSNSDVPGALGIDNSGNVYALGYGYHLVTGSSANDWWIKKFK